MYTNVQMQNVVIEKPQCTMNAAERREARRKRILENTESRLKKIITLTVDEHVSNGQAVLAQNKRETITLNPELPDQPILKYQVETMTPTIHKDQLIFNYEPNHLNAKLYSKNIQYNKFKFSSITILHIILSQFVLVLFYYDLGFLFGNSIVVPFLFSVIPELYTSKERHDSIHIVMLLMLGFSQDLAKQISRCFKLAFITGKRFCIYIFCFTCSYAMLTDVYFNIKHNSSIT